MELASPLEWTRANMMMCLLWIHTWLLLDYLMKLISHHNNLIWDMENMIIYPSFYSSTFLLLAMHIKKYVYLLGSHFVNNSIIRSCKQHEYTFFSLWIFMYDFIPRIHPF